MTCRFFRHEPSFNSRNENDLASRRVRTQPCTKIESRGAELASASLTEIGSDMLPTIALRPRPPKQNWMSNGVSRGEAQMAQKGLAPRSTHSKADDFGDTHLFGRVIDPVGEQKSFNK